MKRIFLVILLQEMCSNTSVCCINQERRTIMAQTYTMAQTIHINSNKSLEYINNDQGHALVSRPHLDDAVYSLLAVAIRSERLVPCWVRVHRMPTPAGYCGNFFSVDATSWRPEPQHFEGDIIVPFAPSTAMASAWRLLDEVNPLVADELLRELVNTLLEDLKKALNRK